MCMCMCTSSRSHMRRCESCGDVRCSSASDVQKPLPGGRDAAHCRRARAEGEGSEREGPEFESNRKCAPLEGHIMAECGHTSQQRPPTTHTGTRGERRPQADEKDDDDHQFPPQSGPDCMRRASPHRPEVVVLVLAAPIWILVQPATIRPRNHVRIFALVLQTKHIVSSYSRRSRKGEGRSSHQAERERRLHRLEREPASGQSNQHP